MTALNWEQSRRNSLSRQYNQMICRLRALLLTRDAIAVLKMVTEVAGIKRALKQSSAIVRWILIN